MPSDWKHGAFPVSVRAAIVSLGNSLGRPQTTHSPGMHMDAMHTPDCWFEGPGCASYGWDRERQKKENFWPVGEWNYFSLLLPEAHRTATNQFAKALVRQPQGGQGVRRQTRCR
jgi:hypothetical protein